MRPYRITQQEFVLSSRVLYTPSFDRQNRREGPEFFVSGYSLIGLLQMEWQLLSFACFVTPLVLISQANASTGKLHDMFRYSVPPHNNADISMESGLSFAKTQSDLLGGNYSIIGGRKEWLDFVRDAPLQRTIPNPNPNPKPNPRRAPTADHP